MQKMLHHFGVLVLILNLPPGPLYIQNTAQKFKERTTAASCPSSCWKCCFQLLLLEEVIPALGMASSSAKEHRSCRRRDLFRSQATEHHQLYAAYAHKSQFHTATDFSLDKRARRMAHQHPIYLLVAGRDGDRWCRRRKPSKLNMLSCGVNRRASSQYADFDRARIILHQVTVPVHGVMNNSVFSSISCFKMINIFNNAIIINYCEDLIIFLLKYLIKSFASHEKRHFQVP